MGGIFKEGKKMAYIFSTLATDMKYSIEGYNDDGTDKTVFIAGQANIPNKHMLTSRGVTTEVPDELIPELKKNRVFQIHLESGVIYIDQKKHDVEKVSADMGVDDSRPLTQPELDALGKKAPRKSSGKRDAEKQ